MSDVTIRVERIGKQYWLGGPQERYSTLRDAIQRAAGAFRRLYRRPTQESGRTPFWALRDVSFEVGRGEVVGIIGSNGAGKSTLLKILSRVTEPTEGGADIFGRVGSLLEVGTGFHPELSGRENVFLNGAILGMRRAEIARKFDEIVAFAEVEKFIDTPVKHYSSGMYMRLAFAVAAHLEPEILVVDEVLAVGDAQFQKKCLGKMGEVAKGGRTVLFVSHNMQAVQSLCGRVIQLRGGLVGFDGDSQSGVSAYLRENTDAGPTERMWTSDDAPGGPHVKLLTARVIPDPGASLDSLTIADGVTFEFEFRVLSDGLRFSLAAALYNHQDICILASPSITDARWAGQPFSAGLYRSRCYLPGGLLNNGMHWVSIYLVGDGANVLGHVARAVSFEARDDNRDRGEWYGEWAGAVRPRLRWDTTPL